MSKPKTLKVVSHTTLVGRSAGDTVEHAPGEAVNLPRGEAEALIARGLAEPHRPPAADAIEPSDDAEANADDPDDRGDPDDAGDGAVEDDAS